MVLGRAPEGAAVQPCLELAGDLGDVLDDLGERGVLQLLVEGGAVGGPRLPPAGLVDRYVLYLAPALFGGDDARGLFAGSGRADDRRRRGGVESSSLRHLGDDLRLDLEGS